MALTMTRDEATSYIKEQSPQVFLDMDKQRKGFVCPECNNGTGSNGDGIKRIPRSNQYKCFKCGFSGDVFDLIGKHFGLSEFNDQFDKAKELYGIDVEKYHSSPSERTVKAQETIKTVMPTPTPSADVSAYLDKCHKAVSETTFFKDRGITQESIDKFNLGYDADFKESTGKFSWKAVIIPTSNETYEARNTTVNPNDDKGSGYKYRKHGQTRIFNLAALSTEKTKPIFVVEGSLDAISIIQSGGQSIGLGSANNYTSLLKELDTVTPAQPLVLLLDNDEAGQKAISSLSAELTKRNIPFITAPEVLGDYHDPNDRLMKDKDGLASEVAKAITKTAEIKAPQDMAKEKYLQTSVSQSIGAFRDMIHQSAQRPKLSTGFNAIDNALDGGLFSGLYIIGAISSLGKTTLTLQIADNLVQQGRDVLFFSLEQSKYDLMSKSISRETFIYCKQNNIDVNNAKSNLGILDGRRWADFNSTENKVVSEAFNKYEGYSKHLFIHEGIGNISVQEIRETVKNHISFTGNKRPIVFIDYLQILKASDGDERATDKQIVDHNVTALKQLSRDFDIPIFAVSSLNRQNYSEEINMAAFKESGAIEYGSDVLIGLQLKGAGEKDFNVNEAKAKSPREVQFCVLKNRNGKITSTGIDLNYYPIFNCFECAGENDGFVTITPDMEDSIPFKTDENGFLTITDEEIAELPFV